MLGGDLNSVNGVCFSFVGNGYVSVWVFFGFFFVVNGNSLNKVIFVKFLFLFIYGI